MTSAGLHGECIVLMHGIARVVGWFLLNIIRVRHATKKETLSLRRVLETSWQVLKKNKRTVLL